MHNSLVVGRAIVTQITPYPLLERMGYRWQYNNTILCHVEPVETRPNPSRIAHHWFSRSNVNYLTFVPNGFMVWLHYWVENLDSDVIAKERQGLHAALTLPWNRPVVSNLENTQYRGKGIEQNG